VTRDGAIVCRSARTETLTASYATTTSHGEVITIAGSDAGFLDFDIQDVLRTYCPGPTDQELLLDTPTRLFTENEEAVAQGVVPLRAFTAARATAGVGRGGAFSSQAYEGGWSGRLRFGLRRTHLTFAVRHTGYHDPPVDQLPNEPPRREAPAAARAVFRAETRPAGDPARRP
jgi:hypothetical protein